MIAVSLSLALNKGKHAKALVSSSRPTSVTAMMKATAMPTEKEIGKWILGGKTVVYRGGRVKAFKEKHLKVLAMRLRPQFPSYNGPLKPIFD